MGQQQLLLIILVSIIVGIATIVAINVFSTSAKSANRDSLRQDVMVIASAAQAYYTRPSMMGGGNNSFTDMTFRDINFAAEAISSDGMGAYNMNGNYLLNTDAGTSFTVTAHPSSDEGYDSSQGFTATSNNPLIATIGKDNINWSDVEEE